MKKEGAPKPPTKRYNRSWLREGECERRVSGRERRESQREMERRGEEEGEDRKSVV